MVDLKAAETSGVDHPAHLAEGWAVFKAAGGDPVELMDRLKAQGIEVEKMAPAALATMLSQSLGQLPESAQGPARALIAALGGTKKEAGMPTLEELTAQVATLTDQVAKATADATAAKAEADAATKARTEAEAALAKAKEPTTPPTEAEALAKAMAELPEPLRKAWEADRAAVAEAQRIATEERDARLSDVYLAKAKELGALPAKPEDLATVMRKAAELLPKEAAAELDRMLKAVDAQLRTGELYKELGSGGGAAGGGTAWEAIESAAIELQKAAAAAGNDLSREAAIDKVSAIQPDLVAKHRSEMRSGASSEGR